MNRIFAIPDFRLEDAKNEFARLNKKAKKLGFSPLGFSVVSRELKEMKRDDGKKFNVMMNNVEISGDDPKISGWSVFGKVEKFQDNAPSLVSIFNYEKSVELPKQYLGCEPGCEHCNKSRNRMKSYILLSDANEFKMVGGACLDDFAGSGNSINEVIGYFEGLIVAQSFFVGGDDELSGFREYGGGIKLIDVLSTACAAVRSNGYVSFSRGEREMILPTGIIVGEVLAGRYRGPAFDITDADVAKAEEIEEWVLSDVFLKKSLESVYEHNLRTIFEFGKVPEKKINLVVSSWYMHDKYLEEKMRQESGLTSDYVGTPGEKIVDYLVKKDKVKIVSGEFGDANLCFFTDPQGNEFIWRSSGKFIEPADGEMVHLSGTIKDHKEDYQGIKKTVLTRAKINEMDLAILIGDHGAKEYNKAGQKAIDKPLNIDVKFCPTRIQHAKFDQQFSLYDLAEQLNESYCEPLINAGIKVGPSNDNDLTADQEDEDDCESLGFCP